MTIDAAMDFIHQTSWQGSHLGLERITELMHRLGDPQNRLKFVHIAGTNGKGSVSTMLSSILTKAGYTTGLYTSPYIYRFNERMKVNEVDISDADLVSLAEQMQPHVAAMAEKPTEFELITAMAFLYFAARKCDIVVLEVGLGGRLDSTNVIAAPEVAVITNLALEHTEVLGDTIEKIAFEKAGIIKPSSSVVLYGQGAAAEAVVREKCRQCGVDLRVTDAALQKSLSADLQGQCLAYRGREGVALGLLGTYQYYNAAVVLDTVDTLISRGWILPEAAIREGLKRATWPGRFEVLTPRFLVDGAHNPNGVEELVHCLDEYLPGEKLTFLLGVMADKDFVDMIAQLVPYANCFITVTPNNPRALASDALKQAIAAVFPGAVTDAGSVQNGLAYATAQPKGRICACGSLYMIGEIRKFFGKYPEIKAPQ